MLNLFKIEWIKIKSYRTFWVLFLGFLILYPIAFYFSASKYMEASNLSLQENALRSLLDVPFLFPKVWQSASWFGGMFFILIGMLFILLITNEVQYKTHRQNIIDGWSRMDFLKAKFSLMLFFVIVATVLVFLCGLLVGLAYSSGADIFSHVYFVGYFALMAIIYLMVAYMVAIFIKRTGLSIIIYFAIVCIVDNILWLVLTLKDSQAGYFMPLEVADSLITNPFKPAIMERRTVADYTLIAAAVVYISVYAYAIINYFRKADLKT